jgi:uncharacterized glyoxalase superfamily protein PhnB
MNAYPLITVKDLAASRDFFVKHFAMAVVFEANWVVMLGFGDDAVALGLMTKDHPSVPPGPEEFDGKGMIVTIQVDDAAAAYEAFVATGGPVHYALKVEPWGQRRFMARDPSGVLVDVVEQIEPAPGFWDKYMGGD